MKKRIFGGLVVIVLTLVLFAVGVSAEVQGGNYDLWIAGKQVTSENLSGNGNSGSWEYDAESKTLTFNNYVYEGTSSGVGTNDANHSIVYSEIDGLTVTGKATITNTGTATGVGTDAEISHFHGIMASGDIKFKDFDAVITTKSESGYGIFTYNATEFDGCNIEIHSLDEGIYLEDEQNRADGNIVINNSTIVIDASSFICAINSDIIINNSTVKTSGDEVLYGITAVRVESVDADVGNIRIDAQSVVTINAQEIAMDADGGNIYIYSPKVTLTSAEWCAVSAVPTLADGIVVYAAETVDGANATLLTTLPSDVSGYKYLRFADEIPYDLWIAGEQVTSANLSGDGWAYDVASKTLTLTDYTYSGEGTAIESKLDALTIVGSGEITTASSGIVASGALYINSTDLIISGCVHAMNTAPIVGNGVYIKAAADAVAADAEYIEWANEGDDSVSGYKYMQFTGEKPYDIWLDGGQLTSGTTHYDPVSNTLTLDGVVFDGDGAAINSRIPGLTIEGSVTIESSGVHAIVVAEGTVFDNFTATIVSDGIGIYVDYVGRLMRSVSPVTIKDSEITISAKSDGIGCKAHSPYQVPLVIENSNLTINVGGSSDIYAGITAPSLSIVGGKVDITSAKHGIYVANGVTLACDDLSINVTDESFSGILSNDDVTITGGSTTIDSVGYGIDASDIVISGGELTVSADEQALSVAPDLSGYVGEHTAIGANNAEGRDIEYYVELENDNCKYFRLASEYVYIPRDFDLPIYVLGAFLAMSEEHTITAEAGDNGSITPEGEVKVRVGLSKTFTIKADKGYVIDSVIVDGEDIGAVEKYTFANVSEDHTISVTFVEEPWKSPYIDVDADDEFYADVEYVTVNGLMDGASNRRFAPKADADLIDVLTALYRLTDASGDVEQWAVESGLVDADDFDENGDITYAEAIAMLVAFADYVGFDATTIASAQTMLAMMVDDMTADVTRADVAMCLRLLGGLTVPTV